MGQSLQQLADSWSNLQKHTTDTESHTKRDREIDRVIEIGRETERQAGES